MGEGVRGRKGVRGREQEMNMNIAGSTSTDKLTPTDNAGILPMGTVLNTNVWASGQTLQYVGGIRVAVHLIQQDEACPFTVVCRPEPNGTCQSNTRAYTRQLIFDRYIHVYT